MMGEGFFEKLKALLMGSQAPPASPQAAPEGKPWEDPSLGPPGMHQMPGGGMMPNAEMPSPAPPGPPGSIADDPMGLAVKLMRQREIAKRALPEGTWNR